MQPVCLSSIPMSHLANTSEMAEAQILLTPHTRLRSILMIFNNLTHSTPVLIDDRNVCTVIIDSAS